MIDPTMPHTPERKLQLLAAASRLHKRLQFATEGIPAGPMDQDGNALQPWAPYVPFAPPWAEDPQALLTCLERVDSCLYVGRDHR